MSYDDSMIISAMRADREQGFNLLWEAYSQPLYWHIRRLTVNLCDAEDVMQETFIRIFRNLHSLRDEGSLSAWLYRIATNEAMRHLSGKRLPVAEPEGEDGPTRLDRVATDDYVDYADAEAVSLQEAILGLPPQQRTAFCLRYYDDLSFAEIARVMETSESSAKASYHVAKEKVKRILTDSNIYG